MKRFTVALLVVLFTLPILAQEQKLTLQDVWASRKFSPKGVYGIRSMADGEHYTVMENDTVYIYEYKTGFKTGMIAAGAEMIPDGDTVPLRLSSYEFSKDEQKLLIPTQTESIYRHSTISEYFIWDIPEKKLVKLSLGGKQRLAEFSPDGSKVAFVRDNDLYVRYLDRGLEVKITHDGETNKIINGTTDWVYEEEFGITKGFQWSPDGTKIAFYRFDESEVKEYFLTEWGELYPDLYTYKYPKAGEDNSLVTVHVYDINRGLTTKMDTGEEPDQYLPRFFWTPDPAKLFIFRLNRLQNQLEILHADAATGKSDVIYTEKSHTYIDEGHYDRLFFVDTDRYILTSEEDDYSHLYLMSIVDRSRVQLTSGPWDVTGVKGYDKQNELVYFTAAAEKPFNREIYSVNLKGKVKKISEEEGWHDPTFSSNFKYYINSYSSVDSPPVYTLRKSNGKILRILEDNADLKQRTEDFGFSETGFFSFTTSEGVDLNGWQLLPPGFDPGKKYPVLMYVYGGPGSQTVTNMWGYNNYIWFQYLAQNGFIVVSVDNRGTGARGQEFKKMTYLELGKYETIDQIEAARYLASREYVDSGRIAIFGWSYGGYLSSLCITRGADHFAAAVAVSPVTNWRYYDNIYTERFMRKPQQNADGYDHNSPIHHVDKLQGKYLLIHGTGDDNVHVQNTMDMVSALQKAGKQFDLMLYPNKNHGIYGGNTRYHLFTRITEFLMENL